MRCEASSAPIPATIWSIRALPTISAATPPAPPIRYSSACHYEANSAPTNRPRPSANLLSRRWRQEVDQTDLRQPGGDRHRRREIGLQRQDIFADLILVDAFNALQHVLQRILSLGIQCRCVGNLGLGIDEVGLDVWNRLRAR